MAAGIQVWDAAGRLIVDTSTMIPRSVVIGEVTSAGAASIIPIQQGVAIGAPVIVPLDDKYPPEVTLSGATLSWRGGNGGGNSFRAYLSVALV